MKHGPFIFLGVLFTFASSWLALVFTPYVQLEFLQPVEDPDTRDVYPVSLAGLAADGEGVYARNGCIYCHSQQVRPEGFGADFERGWGPRRTVARDYLYDRRVMLGTMRTGPDLANIGARAAEQVLASFAPLQSADHIARFHHAALRIPLRGAAHCWRGVRRRFGTAR